MTGNIQDWEGNLSMLAACFREKAPGRCRGLNNYVCLMFCG